MYTPPFTITNQIVNLVAQITEIITKLSFVKEENVRLRKINRLKSIQGSLAIEGNTLTTDQITAIIEGKNVIGTIREIQEVKNAIVAYDNFDKFNPYKVKDLLQAHQMLTTGLINESGKFRSGNVGVFDGERPIHIAPPPERVPLLIDDLFQWLKSTSVHPLIASAVFHYEFEFIHPFNDGNGRTGRLWQSLILNKWNSTFAHMPVENIVYQQQKYYYKAINESSQKADSSPFVEFMLQSIYNTLEKHAPEVTPEVTPEVKKLLVLLKTETLSRVQIQQLLGLKDEKNVRIRYIQPALQMGLVKQTNPEKPNSKLQKYSITEKGMSVFNIMQQ